MNKFEQIKDFFFTKRNIIIFTLFVVPVLVEMYTGEIKNFFGFPNVTMRIEDKESPLLDYLLDHHEFNDDWDFFEVFIMQRKNDITNYSSAYLFLEGEYKQTHFVVDQFLDFSPFQGRYDNSEDYHFQEIFIDNDHPENEINTYCYFVDRIDETKQDFTSCTLLQEIDGIPIDIELEIYTKLNKEEAIQIAGEIKAIMENPKPR